MGIGAGVVCWIVGWGVGIGDGALEVGDEAITALSMLVDQISVPLNSMMA